MTYELGEKRWFDGREYEAGPMSQQPGIGLGLSIRRDLARAWVGDLAVASKLGEGFTFTLSLPRA